jgi:hypothetical protein
MFQTDAGIEHRLGHDRFHPNPFKFINHPIIHHSQILLMTVTESKGQTHKPQERNIQAKVTMFIHSLQWSLRYDMKKLIPVLTFTNTAHM